MRKFLAVLSIVAALVLGTGKIASAQSQSFQTVTFVLPMCSWQGSVNNGPNHYFVMQQTITGCDLLVSDFMYPPHLTMYAFDVEDASSSPYYTTNSPQNQTAVGQFASYSCHWGHRYYIDFYSRTWRGKYQGHFEFKARCGGGLW